VCDFDIAKLESKEVTNTTRGVCQYLDT